MNSVELRQLFEREQDTRLQRDPWEDKLREFLHSNTMPYYTSKELLTQAMEKPVGTQTRADMNRVAPIMKAIGWHKERKTLGGDRHWVYVRPEKPGGPDLPGGDE